MLPFKALQRRSYAPERLDAPDLPAAALWQNLRELDVINRRLGGHAVTLQALQRLLGSRPRRCRILDVGCGGGDTLRAVGKWGRAQGHELHLTGIDLQPACVAYAQAQPGGEGIVWLEGDYRQWHGETDIVISALFCHHLDEFQLREFLRWIRQQRPEGFVINDLQRHVLAYYGIAALTRLLKGSELVRHDAPLSVWRGFQADELRAACADAGLYPHVNWDWAFRWQVWGHV
ncbi:MAG: methyltransferase domain-containing protein [Candidatus Sericytochromatia bacterium]